MQCQIKCSERSERSALTGGVQGPALGPRWGPGGGAPGSSWVLAVFRWKRMGLWACCDTVFNYFKFYALQWLKISNSKVHNSWTFQKGFFTHLCSSNDWSGTLKTLPMLRNQASIGWISWFFLKIFYLFFIYLFIYYYFFVFWICSRAT